MNTPINLDSAQCIGEGATRSCYLDPTQPTRCLKIEKAPAAATNRADLAAYLTTRDILHPFLIRYEEHLLPTSRGDALACETLRDTDGTLSASFAHYRQTHPIEEGLIMQFHAFFQLIMENDLFFFDLNPRNFLIQQTPDGPKLKYTDLKSLGKTRTFFALERIRFFARRKLKRRIDRFIARNLPSS